VTVADLAIIAGLVFAWGTWSARLERFDVTAPIVFTVAGVLLTHGPLAPLGITPGTEVVKVLAEATLALVLFSDASRVGLHPLRAASRYGPRLTPPSETAAPAGLAEIPERRLIRRQPTQGTGELLMTADQIPLRAGRRRRTGSPCGRVRAR